MFKPNLKVSEFIPFIEIEKYKQGEYWDGVAVILNGEVKRNKITDKDMANGDAHGFIGGFMDDPKIEPNFICFDFDCKGKEALLEDEALESAKNIHEILGFPSPAVIQRSRSGRGVHLLIKVKEKLPMFVKNTGTGGKKWIVHSMYERLFECLNKAYTLDKSTFKGNQVAYLTGKTDNKKGFLCINKWEENKPLTLTEELLLTVKNFTERTRTKVNVQDIITRSINTLARSQHGSRTNMMFATVYNIYGWSWVTGFRGDLIKKMVYDACVENGMVEQYGEGEFERQYENAAKAGKADRKGLPTDGLIAEQLDTDIIYNKEIDHESKIAKEVLNRLSPNIYYMKEGKLFWNSENDNTYETLKDAMVSSNVRFYRVKGKKESLERVTNYDAILTHALTKYQVNEIDWKRHVNCVITRPTLYRERILKKAGHDSDFGVFCKIPAQTDSTITLNKVLKGYNFMSERSKIYAVTCMIAAFGANHWWWKKPAFYFHALSNAGRNSGKTTLARICCGIRSEQVAEVNYSSTPNGLEEMRKQLLYYIRNMSSRAILIDNLPSNKNQFSWTQLDSWLTSPEWTQRILQTSENFSTRNDLLYTLTGNMCGLSDDLMVRTSVIVFSDVFDEEAKDPDVNIDKSGLNLSYLFSDYFEKWMKNKFPQGEVPDDISSYNKYPDFWKDVSGLLDVIKTDDTSGISDIEGFGDLSTYEASHLTGKTTQYSEVVEVLRGQYGTVKTLYLDNKEKFQHVLYGGNKSPDKLEKILLDFANKELLGVSISKEEDGSYSRHKGDLIFEIEKEEE